MYLALDTESGGFAGSLLQVYIAVVDNKFYIQDELNLFLRPNDNIYCVTPESLKLTNTNLLEHDAKAVTYKTAGQLIYKFLSPYTKNRLTPLGHGVREDCELIKENLITSWDNFVNSVYIDTLVLARYLQDCGKIPTTQALNLAALYDFYKLDFHGTWHTARSDALASVNIYQTILNLK